MPGVRAALLPVALVLLLTACEVRAPAGNQPELSAPTAAAVDRLLATRATAVLSGSAESLTATGASDADGSVRDLAGRLAGLPVTAWAYRVHDVRSGPGPSAVTVRALLTYRFRTDPAAVPPASAERELVVVADPAAGGAARVRSERPVGAWLPWDVGAARWSQTGAGAVLDLRGASADVTTARAIAAAAGRATRAVTAVWGSTGGRTPLVVAVGGTTALAELTGRPLATTSGLVAVTTIDRVYLDVAAWLALPPAGRQVLLTHEVTHLATGSAGDDAVPLWLEEGFADVVGLTGSGLSVRTVAAATLDPVRNGDPPPASLPADADFDAGGVATARAYAGAWLACRLVVATVGLPGLVAVYRATQTGTASPAANADAALLRVTGRGTTAWTARWRTWLRAAVSHGGPSLAVVA